MKLFIAFAALFVVTLSQAQKLEKVWSSPLDFRTPESVLYNADLNIVFVANMGKTYDKKNGDGFISQMDINGTIKKVDWLTGLNDPKGMAVVKGKLYVADIDELVEIDIKEAKILKKYPAKGAKFLNDVVAGNGAVYVSDSRDQRIYALQFGKFSSWLNNDDLKKINGLWFENGKLYAASTNIWEISVVTKKMTKLVSNDDEIDGIESIGNGNFIFSNWNGKIYVSDKGKVIKLLDTSAEKLNTADIDFVPEQKLVLVPTFFGNNVDAYKLVW